MRPPAQPWFPYKRLVGAFSSRHILGSQQLPSTRRFPPNHHKMPLLPGRAPAPTVFGFACRILQTPTCPTFKRW